MCFGEVEIWPEGKKLPKRQYSVYQHFEICFSVYTLSVLPVEAASVSAQKHRHI